MRTSWRRPLELLCTALLLCGCPDGVTPLDPGGTGTTTGPELPSTTTGSDSSDSGVVDDTGTSASTGDPGDPQDCCAAHPEAGCEDPALATCVCDEQPSCCAFEWEATCVEQAELCGGCGAATTGGTASGTTGDTTGDTTGPSGACCAPSQQSGCPEDPMLETCVCAFDPFCCDTEWDGKCVQAAQLECGADCSMDAGDCCTAHGSPHCDDPAVSTCVCALDPFCCDTEWDSICVNEAQYACMTDCGLPPANDGDCCSATAGPGCDDPMVTECTCLIEDGCCLFPWDDGCIQLAVTSCGIMCPGVEPLDLCCTPHGTPGCPDMAVQDCVCAFDPFCCDTEWDGMCVDGAQMSCMLVC